jgi:monovalent cation/hydrogen antiporter
MEEVATVLFLLFLVTLLAVITRRWTIPYPTVMVLTGLVVAMVPGLPHVQLMPEVVFLIFLPPLLYAAAFDTPWNDFRRNLRPIVFLAIGLVLVTTFAVGMIVRWLVPEIPWAAAFALGAIVSPPDAIAATSLTRHFPIPRRIVSILEGESLLNDATGLVVYRMATLAAISGSFSWSSSLNLFLISSAGGILLGLVAGFLVVRVHRFVDDPVVETMMSLLTPYAVYLPCEWLHLSGVLAVVTAGLYVQRSSQWIFSSATRLHARSVWESVLFVLNGLTFIFIGLGLRDVVQSLDDNPWWWNLLVAAIVVAVTILVRLAGIVLTGLAAKNFYSSNQTNEGPLPLSHLWVIGWTGMRGVVSLAAAMALPINFPHRELILFVVFCVILATLVLQSLSLPWLIRKLSLGNSGRSLLEQERDARLWMLAAANTYLENAASNEQSEAKNIEFLRGYFETHANRVLANLELELEHLDSEQLQQTPVCRGLHLGALWAQRDRIEELEESGVIERELSMQLYREIDLEETRLRSPSTMR